MLFFAVLAMLMVPSIETAQVDPPTSGANSAPSAPAGAPNARTAALQAMVTPLREIGRVRARTVYCSTLQHSAAPAANSAVAFELGLIAIESDIVAFTAPKTTIAKATLSRALQVDLRTLADLSRSGRDRLNALRDLAKTSTPDDAREILGLRDALDGAKARQWEVVKDLARVVGTLEERPVYSIINQANDPSNIDTLQNGRLVGQPGQVPLRINDPNDGTLPVDYLQAGDYAGVLSAGQRFFDTIPKDIRIRDDLDRAAEHADAALASGKCELPGAAASPSP